MYCAPGSPPHTRGKLVVPQVANYRLRLTPAHAGKTYPLSRCRPQTQAHPRTRGENSFWPPRARTHIGSPPHTRGKRSAMLAIWLCNRLTPAHAGKTLKKPRISKDFLSWLITVYLVPNKFYESTYSLSMPYAPVWHPAKKMPPSLPTHNPPNHPISDAQCAGCP